ncbi:hypothetical protein ACFWGN_04430 [Oerskovia sp. NPDC060338]|uniref:hypothetical protein n=1 Tax=Oerskovia sp. NPDC060338 TaxID=3347100 RepID=UPI003656FA35
MTTNTTSPSMSRRPRTLLVVALGGLAALTLSACGSIAEGLEERDAGHTKTFAFETGKEGKDEKVVPTWVPDDAAKVRGIFRTTGDERLVTFQGSLDGLPADCTAVSADDPLVARPERGDLVADDYRTDSTLLASWWPEGQEARSTVICGKWWISAEGEDVYAFTPEMTRVEIEKQPTPAGT